MATILASTVWGLCRYKEPLQPASIVGTLEKAAAMIERTGNQGLILSRNRYFMDGEEIGEVHADKHDKLGNLAVIVREALLVREHRFLVVRESSIGISVMPKLDSLLNPRGEEPSMSAMKQANTAHVQTIVVIGTPIL